MNDNVENTNEPTGGDGLPQTMRDASGQERPLTDAERAASMQAYAKFKAGGGKPTTQKPAAKEKTEGGEAGDESQEAQQQDQRDGDNEAPAELSAPEETPREHVERVEGFMEDLAPITRELNIPTSEVQDVVNFAVSLAVMDRSGVNLEDPAACEQVLQNQYGRDEAQKIIADARAAVQKLGPKMADFLDATLLGSDPSVLYSLAAWKRGDLRMSPERAQRELDKLKGEDLRTSAWKNPNHPGHKAAVARVNMLYAIAAKGDVKAEARKAAEPKASAKSSAKQAQEAELKSLLAHPAYRDRGHRESASVRARIEALYSTPYPGDKD